MMLHTANSKIRAQILLVAIPMLAVTLITPLGFDNAIYQSMAIDLLKFGKIPYIGSYDQNFLGVLVIHLSAMALFGQSVLAFRAFDALLQLGFVFVLYRFERNWLTHRTAMIGIVLYCSWYLLGSHRIEGERDVYIGMALVCAMQLLLGAKSAKLSNWRFCLSALALGFAILTKPTSLIFPLLIVWMVPRNEYGAWWKQRVVYLGMTLIPIGAFLVTYALIPGGLRAFYLVAIQFNIDLYGTIKNNFWDSVRTQFEVFPIYGLTIVALVASAYQILRPRILDSRINLPHVSRRDRNVIGGLILATLAVFVLQGKYYGYQLAPATILCVPIAAFGVEYILLFVPERARSMTAVIWCIAIAVASIRWLSVLTFFSLINDPRGAFRAYYCRPGTNPVYGEPAIYATMDYLNRPENLGATIEIAALDAHLRAILGRQCIGKYALMTTLGLRRNPDVIDSNSYTEYQRRWRSEYIDDLRVFRPQFIVVARNFGCLYLSDVYADVLHEMEGYDELLSSNYREDTAFGGYHIYRLLK